jgi:hypothetical protein
VVEEEEVMMVEEVVEDEAGQEQAMAVMQSSENMHLVSSDTLFS